MQRKWADYFVDPENGSPLELEFTSEENDSIIEGCLRTATGKRQYPIKAGIPRFVTPDLYDESLPIISDGAQTGRSFGDLWRTDVNRELGRVPAEYKSVEEQFLAMLGVSNREELSSIFTNGLNCLNAGCGVGWSEYLFPENAGVNRFAIDVSLAVESAYRNTKQYDHVVVAQADIFALPFANGFFDIIYSAGVLHHTRNAGEAFDHLCRCLRPGGLIGIYVYNVKPLIREMADKVIRSRTTEMTFRECFEFSRPLTQLGKSLQKYREPLVVEADIPMLGIKKGEYDLQKFVFDHFIKCFYNEGMGEEYSSWTNVDWYHPKYASHHTREEVASWFARNRIGDVVFTSVSGWEHSGFFVSGRKQKTGVSGGSPHETKETAAQDV